MSDDFGWCVLRSAYPFRVWQASGPPGRGKNRVNFIRVYQLCLTFLVTRPTGFLISATMTLRNLPATLEPPALAASPSFPRERHRRARQDRSVQLGNDQSGSVRNE